MSNGGSLTAQTFLFPQGPQQPFADPQIAAQKQAAAQQEQFGGLPGQIDFPKDVLTGTDDFDELTKLYTELGDFAFEMYEKGYNVDKPNPGNIESMKAAVIFQRRKAEYFALSRRLQEAREYQEFAQKQRGAGDVGASIVPGDATFASGQQTSVPISQMNNLLGEFNDAQQVFNTRGEVKKADIHREEFIQQMRNLGAHYAELGYDERIIEANVNSIISAAEKPFFKAAIFAPKKADKPSASAWTWGGGNLSNNMYSYVYGQNQEGVAGEGWNPPRNVETITMARTDAAANTFYNIAGRSIQPVLMRRTDDGEWVLIGNEKRKATKEDVDSGLADIAGKEITIKNVEIPWKDAKGGVGVNFKDDRGKAFDPDYVMRRSLEQTKTVTQEQLDAVLAMPGYEDWTKQQLIDYYRQDGIEVIK